LTKIRRFRLVQYYYKEAHMMSVCDREALEAVVSHIHSLDPAFVPRDEERQWFMRLAARLLGFRRAVLLHSSVKRLFH
jgi:hypothetical protein